ncbi:putative cyclin [Rosa chinensis]|uniref:B-like cyclin n=1 Tax=Rosa chinensis TaxID=74649 RepID=A0A2P6Q3E6_ROSCH|nr:putative cyclin-D6-1 [Rosa chinensis]PRQ28696.1 putative cyclin [Rosa chinensis]
MRSFSFPSLLLSSSNNFCSHVLNSLSSSSITQNKSNMELFDLEEHNPDSIPDLFASETDHMPSQNFLTSSIHSDFYCSFRLEAISLFLQAQYSSNLDPFIPYLAIDYMDRFISKQNIPQGKPWVSRLVEVACLSLAAKMKNTSFSFSDFQRREEGFMFEAQTINKMELVILDTLNWRMRSITPFSFLHFFVSLVDINERPLTQALKSRASDVIFNAHNEIKFVEFKPSVIAASAVLFASHELLPLQFPSLKVSISSCQYVNKESLLKCLNLMQEMIVNEGYDSVLDTLSCTTRTPMSVLDHRYFSSSESEVNSTGATTTTAAAAAYADSSTSSVMVAEKRDSKRRRLNGFCTSENRFQVSSHHFQHC